MVTRHDGYLGEGPPPSRPGNLPNLPLTFGRPSAFRSLAFSGLLRNLQLSLDRRSAALARLVHGRAVTLGIQRHPLLSARLVTAYSILSSLSVARLVFEDSPHHDNTFLWNSILAAYSRASLFAEPVSLFRRMLLRARPDDYTLAIVGKAAGELDDLRAGRSVHALAVRQGFVSDVVLLNSLVGMYLTCREAGDARNLFDEIPVRSVSSWNLLISECASLSDGIGRREEVWNLLVQMQDEGLKPDAFTISILLPLFSLDSETGLRRGREIHCYVLRNRLALGSKFDSYVGSSLIDMYSKGGQVVLGRFIFDEMVCKNVVAWTAMISGYVQNGESKEALMIFRSMQFEGRLVPNKVTLLSVLSAIGSLVSLIAGKEVHGFAIRAALNSQVSLNNALIDMYSKCGSLDYARGVFDDDSWYKDAISWGSIISGYGQHGRGNEAVSLFHEISGIGIQLDHITCVGILSACARSGLVDEGLKIYTSLINNHNVFPTTEMCSCIVDMLCRAGQLKQALDFIYLMPVDSSPSVWGTFVCSSLIHGNKEMQDLAYNILLQLEPNNPSNYVSLSNLHASSGRWDVVSEVRTKMKQIGFRKLPGCSWISLSNEVHSFYVADKSHPHADMIYPALDNLTLMMKEAAYLPNVDFFNATSII